MLTAMKLAALKPRTAIYRIADAAGLCIEVRPDGGRSWRYRYRFAGTARMLSLGTYPQVSLAEARKRRDEARNVLQSGRDPSSERKADKLRVKLSVENTFGAIATEWLEQQRGKLADITYHKSEWLFSFVTPALGARPIADIGAGDSRRPTRHRGARSARDRTPRQAARRPGVSLRHRHRPRRARPKTLSTCWSRRRAIS